LAVYNQILDKMFWLAVYNQILDKVFWLAVFQNIMCLFTMRYLLFSPIIVDKYSSHLFCIGSKTMTSKLLYNLLNTEPFNGKTTVSCCRHNFVQELWNLDKYKTCQNRCSDWTDSIYSSLPQGRHDKVLTPMTSLSYPLSEK
jgi:hypothetical protein